MGSDRPEQGENPEHVERPASVAERIERYEEQVSADRADPEIWKRIDPFERMSLDQIKRLHLPDRVNQEPETVRRIRTDHGDRDAGDHEPTGDELLETENDKRSLRERVRTEAFKQADNILDVTKDRGNELEAALKGPEPTGTETRHPSPIPYVTERRHDDAGVGDIASGVLAATLAGHAAVHQMRSFVQELRKGARDAGH